MKDNEYKYKYLYKSVSENVYEFFSVLSYMYDDIL